jgi:hypothetical protein
VYLYRSSLGIRSCNCARARALSLSHTPCARSLSTARARALSLTLSLSLTLLSLSLSHTHTLLTQSCNCRHHFLQLFCVCMFFLSSCKMLRSRSLSSDDAAIACSVRSNSSEGDGTRRGASRCLWSWVTATVYPEVYPSDMPPLLARRGASRCLWSWEAERRQAEAQKHNSITYTRTRFFFPPSAKRSSGA